MSSIRSNRLVAVDEAKNILREKLQPRISEYEERLKKNIVKQAIAYFSDLYGEKGYIRTLDFLKDMDEKQTTEDLMTLIQEDKYMQGTNMPLLLKEAALLICGVTAGHFEVVVSDVRTAQISEYGIYAGFNLLQADEMAQDRIYDMIIRSPDYGAGYLGYLDRQLIKLDAIRDRQSQPAESVEMSRIIRRA